MPITTALTHCERDTPEYTLADLLTLGFVDVLHDWVLHEVPNNLLEVFWLHGPPYQEASVALNQVGGYPAQDQPHQHAANTVPYQHTSKVH
jgi:hypothetical protein